MPLFRVRCYEGAIWDGAEPRYVDAADEWEAAEITCGSHSSRRERLGCFALKWLATTPAARKLFYVRDQQNSN